MIIIIKSAKKILVNVFSNIKILVLSITCSKYDLYSKSKVRVDVEKVKPYYISLIEKVSTSRKLLFPFFLVEKIKVVFFVGMKLRLFFS